MSIVKEFREFAVRGNVVDMAVGIVIGAAFGKIVSSFVADVIMPPMGLLIGGVSLGHLELEMRAAEAGVPAVTLKYGAFAQTVFDFFLIALAVFVLIKLVNRVRRQAEAPKAPPAPVEPPRQEVLLSEIRDLLKARQNERQES